MKTFTIRLTIPKTAITREMRREKIVKENQDHFTNIEMYHPASPKKAQDQDQSQSQINNLVRNPLNLLPRLQIPPKRANPALLKVNQKTKEASINLRIQNWQVRIVFHRSKRKGISLFFLRTN